MCACARQEQGVDGPRARVRASAKSSLDIPGATGTSGSDNAWHATWRARVQVAVMNHTRPRCAWRIGCDSLVRSPQHAGQYTSRSRHLGQG